MSKNVILITILAVISNIAFADNTVTWYDDPDQYYAQERRQHPQKNLQELQEQKRLRAQEEGLALQYKWQYKFPTTRQYVVALSAGEATSNSGTTQTFYIQRTVQKTYEATNTNQFFPAGEIFAGVQLPFMDKYLAQMGLSVAASRNLNLSGNIWEDADPDFNNYSYSYNVSHTDVSVKGKFLVDVSQIAMPYVSGSVGYGCNKAGSFGIMTKLFQEVAAPAFQGNNTTSFTYSLGLGVQKMLGDHFQVGIGYEFADWGKTALARAPGQTVNSGLAESNIYINSILLTVGFTR